MGNATGYWPVEWLPGLLFDQSLCSLGGFCSVPRAHDLQGGSKHALALPEPRPVYKTAAGDCYYPYTHIAFRVAKQAKLK